MISSSKTSPVLSLILLIVLVDSIINVDYGVVGVALPSIGLGLKASPSLLQWIISAYSLALGGLVIVGGRITDTFGEGRSCVVGCSLSVVGLILAAGASSIIVLIAARCIQGVAAAILLPIPLSLTASRFPAGPERLRVLGIIAGAGMFIMLGGGLMAGLFITHIGWRGGFLVMLPFPIVSMLLGYYVLGTAKPIDAKAQSIDLSAAAAITVGLTLLIWSLSGIVSSVSTRSTARFVVLTIGVAILCGFAFLQGKSKNPLIPPRILHYPNFAAAIVLFALFNITIGGESTVVHMSLQRAAGYTPFQSALMYLPKGFWAAFLGFVVIPRIGNISLSKPRLTLIVLILAVIGAEVILSFASPAHGVILTFLPCMLIVTTATVLSYPIMMGEVFRHVPEGERGIASALVHASRFIFMAVGLSVVISSIDANVGGASVQLKAFANAYRVSAGFGLLCIMTVIFLLRSNVGQSPSTKVVANALPRQALSPKRY